MDLALFGYALPVIRAEWNLSLGDLRWVLFFSFALGGVLLVWLGLLSDRHGRRRMLEVSILSSSVFITAQALATGPVVLTLLRGLSIATGGLAYPVSGALVAEQAPARYRGIFTGMLQTGYPMGWFLASLFAAPLLVALGWRVVFLVGLISIPYVWVIHRYLKESQRFASANRPTDRTRLADLFTPVMRRRTVTLFIAQFLFVLAYGGSALLFPTYFVEARGYEIGSAAYLVGIGNGLSVIGYLLAAVVGEFVLTRRNTVVIWTLAGAASFMWLVWGTEGFADSIIAFAVMSMFFYGAAAVKFAFVAEVFPTRLRATGLAFSSSLAVTLGTATGPVLVLTAVERMGWDMAFSIFVAVPLVLAGLFYLFLEPLPSGLEVEEVERRLARHD
jgi:putative MFS transporter